ncbi:sulfotransferase family cytosolic 2B member 1 isoform X2 [Alligator sinensis]|uniref:Sulfotransferase n=1 Tax=Alligator sinensis TaxID=38654 RepID=A0A3Q0GZG6_ALLSI|nr:sulfotransferase family cytosolic 2B member 1 isoform X2 [Alligator sinensis]
MFKEYFQYKGISFPEFIYSPCALQTVENNFQVLDDDVFNVTYQKSGTVWMLEILSLIQSNGDPSWCQTVPNWDRAPWYETVLGLRRARRNHSPRLISSHLPIQLFAKSFFKSKAKVIYTIRNPKDVLVSLYHFAQMFHPFKDPGSLDQFLEEFLKGDVPFGSWFDHVRGWMGLQGHENFFYITYEELLQGSRGTGKTTSRLLRVSASTACTRSGCKVWTSPSPGTTSDSLTPTLIPHPRELPHRSTEPQLEQGQQARMPGFCSQV